MEGPPSEADRANLPPHGDRGELRQAIMAGELAESVRMLGLTLRLSVVVATLILVLLWNVIPHATLLTWYVVHHLTALWRASFVWSYKRAPPEPEKVLPHAKHYIISAAFTGMMWGSVGLFLLPPQENPLHGVVLVILIGVSAVSLFTLAPLFPSYLALILPLLGPVGVQSLLTGTTAGLWWGVTLLVFMVAALSNGKRYNRNLAESLRLRFELERYAHELAKAKSESESRYHRIAELEGLRDDLVQMVIHDLKSPLTVIRGNLGLLEMGMAEGSDPDDLDALRLCSTETSRMTQMVNSLLDVSRLESQNLTLDYAETDIRATVDQARSTLGTLGAERIRIETADGRVSASATCDSHLVQRVVANLLWNALDHSPREEFVRVRVEPSYDSVRVQVRDRGPGVPEDLRDKIFDKFVQVEGSREEKKGSTGLGLAFCKLAVDTHSGHIGVRDNPGGGSIFWFEIPKKPPTRHAPT